MTAIGPLVLLGAVLWAEAAQAQTPVRLELRPGGSGVDVVQRQGMEDKVAAPAAVPGGAQDLQVRDRRVWVPQDHPGVAGGLAAAGGGVLAIGLGVMTGAAVATGLGSYEGGSMMFGATPIIIPAGAIMLGVGGYRYRHWSEMRGSSPGEFVERTVAEARRKRGLTTSIVGGSLCALATVGLSVGGSLAGVRHRDNAFGIVGFSMLVSSAILALPGIITFGVGTRIYGKYDHALNPQKYALSGSGLLGLAGSLQLMPYASREGTGILIGGRI